MIGGIDFSTQHSWNWLKQSTNLFAADFVGTAVELGTVSQMARLEAAFPTLSKTVIDTITPSVAYLQGPIEWGLDLGTNFEGEELKKKRKNKAPEERTKDIAHGLVHYLVPIGIGWTTTFGTEAALRYTINKAPHISPKFWAQDMLIHLGLITMMGTPMLSPATHKAKDVVNVVSKVFGADDEQAEDIARLAVLSAVPNYTTFAIVSRNLFKHHKKLAEELEATTALSHTH